jgi:hypothetical protein
MLHTSSETPNRETPANASPDSAAITNARLRRDEPPIEHPRRLSYLVTLLQQELSAAHVGDQ